MRLVKIYEIQGVFLSQEEKLLKKPHYLSFFEILNGPKYLRLFRTDSCP